ncbi:MAG TPA: hypothetical protein VLB68_25070 [Pyrinomonadaceae bacterium]|nr:hypothetical protein [Pyrinomonadaceae bacterium]
MILVRESLKQGGTLRWFSKNSDDNSPGRARNPAASPTKTAEPQQTVPSFVLLVHNLSHGVKPSIRSHAIINEG